ncbi:MAG: helix-turn-helix transcriptional regulator [Eubacterium sp.]|nr:helix-turn-helix transcriptional regulator [Eubacterium sp.]
MPELNRKIQKYISRSQVTVYQLAKNTGLDRTMIQKMIKGTKYPGVKFFYKFCDALMLNRDEREELIQLFRIEKEGYSRYQSRREIGNLLAKMQSVLEEYEYQQEIPISIPDLPPIDGRSVEVSGNHNVRLFMYAFLQDQVREKAVGDIYMDVCRWTHNIMKKLYHYLVDGAGADGTGNVVIHQQVMLSYVNTLSESTFENIISMRKILPSVFMFGKNYHVRFAYVNNARDEHIYVPFRHYLLGKDRLFLFNDDGDRGISITDPVFIQGYRREVLEIEAKSRPLFRYADHLAQAAELMQEINQNYRMVASYGVTPGISLFASAGDYVVPGEKEARILYWEAGEKLFRAMEDPDFIQIYGTAGMEPFIKEGVFPPPADWYISGMQTKDRIAVIQAYTDFLRESRSSYLLKNEKGAANIFSGFDIRLYAPNRILISQSGPGIPRGLLLLEENSMFESFLDYFRSLIEYEDVYLPKEGAEQFCKIMDKYISEL